MKLLTIAMVALIFVACADESLESVYGCGPCRVEQNDFEYLALRTGAEPKTSNCSCK